MCNSSHAKGKVLAGPDNPERSEESIRSLEKGTTYKYIYLVIINLSLIHI